MFPFENKKLINTILLKSKLLIFIKNQLKQLQIFAVNERKLNLVENLKV